MTHPSKTTGASSRRTTGTGILIIDDFFPNLTTGFRIAEYNHYLRVFPDLLIASTVGEFKALHDAFAKSYPDLKRRVVPFDATLPSRARLCYLNFLNNAYGYLAHLEDAALPFVFTLYPGGGFELRSAESNAKLDRVLKSPLLRGVISTQSVTTSMLRDLKCPVPVYDIFGATINQAYMRIPRPPAPRGADLNICFVAHKYDPQGRSKGYPIFVEVATAILQRHSDVTFSVVGNYGPDDISLPEQLLGKLSFKGLLPTPQLQHFLGTQDVMISPNQAFTISGSVFDGFPTASAVEASLCGVAVVCSDELNLNHYYDEDQMIVCAPAAADILNVLEPLLQDRARITRLGDRGRDRSRSLFSAEAQLLPRTRIL